VAQSYRVQYSRKSCPSEWQLPKALTIDLEVDLDHTPGLLPPEAYVMSIEDLISGEK